MLPNRQMQQPTPQENPLWVSWHDSSMIATLNGQNVMDYFCRKSNPFYERTCNNETIRMQRLSMEHLVNMVGVEYILLHVAEPILYVVRKQHRHSQTNTTPMADYYIIAGTIYKAPDLGNVVNSRILNTVNHLQSAFEEVSGYARYNPNKGYSWDFTANKSLSDKSKSGNNKNANQGKDESATVFQKQRVDMLLAELLRKFPPPIPPTIHQQQMQQQQQHQQQQQQAQQPQQPQQPQAQPPPQQQQQQQPVQQQQTPQPAQVAPPEGTTNESVTAPASVPPNNGSQINPAEASPAPPQPSAEAKTDNVDMKPPPEKKLKTT
ncbi:mediator of RNA polymerase II transcription subunit 6 [Teleopsis dalmanni]|uniref:mediator of RNA polymerase II transcription subunit 6 n=1 Tax=Teleopsis dalmanni TaxID=139649 RepID=UPI0018CF1824|nr:mediator of RNA polymerase II transcription subunit 6 [Teleopsis dalmanni]